jgi:hypothetical protein
VIVNRPFYSDPVEFNILWVENYLAGDVEFFIKKFLTRLWEQVFNTSRNPSRGKGI